MKLEEKIKWAILVTGWGKNARDTIEAFHKGLFKNSEISLLIYEVEPCGAKEMADLANVKSIQLLRSSYKDMSGYQDQLATILIQEQIDYIFMLNFKYIIKHKMLEMFPNRIINIHPSLFPSFLATKTAIQDALAYGVKISGITTHIIDDKIDEGIILCQEAIKIPEHSTFETIYPKFSKKGSKIVLKTINKIEKMHKKTPHDKLGASK